MLKFEIITIFPKALDSYFNESILKRAQAKKLIKIKIHNLRDFTDDRRQTVDGRPYGGGPGMILKVEPVFKALKGIKRPRKSKVILFTPQGRTFNQKLAKELSKLDQLVLIAGHYEGLDARVEKFCDLKLSIGDYVLSGGEPAATVVIDAVTRLIPGVLGNEASTKEESFAEENYVEYPQYTRPADFKGLKVPKVLLSGDHRKIKEWRQSRLKRKRG